MCSLPHAIDIFLIPRNSIALFGPHSCYFNRSWDFNSLRQAVNSERCDDRTLAPEVQARSSWLRQSKQSRFNDEIIHKVLSHVLSPLFKSRRRHGPRPFRHKPTDMTVELVLLTGLSRKAAGRHEIKIKKKPWERWVKAFITRTTGV
jgi:hypothetical protein